MKLLEKFLLLLFPFLITFFAINHTTAFSAEKATNEWGKTEVIESERSKIVEDTEAFQLVLNAREKRATWDDKFPGFTADANVNYNGNIQTGTIKITSGGDVEVNFQDEKIKRWVNDTLASVVVHRLERAIEEPNPKVRIGQDDNHPLGQLLVIDDEFDSELRIRDSKFLQINRTIGDARVSVMVLDTEENTEGKYLPIFYTVNYSDPETGEQVLNETVKNEWVRVGNYDLPLSRKTVNADRDREGVKVFVLKLSGHKLISE